MPIAYIVEDTDKIRMISLARDYGAISVDLSDEQLADMQRIQDEWQAMQTVLATILATHDAELPARTGAA